VIPKVRQNGVESIDCMKQESLTGIEVRLWWIFGDTFSNLLLVFLVGVFYRLNDFLQENEDILPEHFLAKTLALLQNKSIDRTQRIDLDFQ
jgi:hypothetical protein